MYILYLYVQMLNYIKFGHFNANIFITINNYNIIKSVELRTKEHSILEISANIFDHVPASQSHTDIKHFFKYALTG